MSAQSSQPFSVAILSRAALFAIAAGCAGSGAGASGGGAPAPITCTFVADSGAVATDTIRFVAEPGAAPGARDMPADACGDTATGAAPFVDSVALPRGADLRDLLGRGLATPGSLRVDVLVTRDPDVLAYAAQLGGYRSFGLPWDRTYALVAPRTDSAAMMPNAAQRDALAQDAVQADARGAPPPFWWEHDTTCTSGTTRTGGGAPRVVGYAADDPIARQLAERIVALAAARSSQSWIPPTLVAGPGGPLRTVGFAPVSLSNALASGQVAAFVGAYPRSRPASCTSAARVPTGATFLPLVDSRAHVLVRQGSGAAFYIRSDGALRFVPNRTP
jgi:hypothetical protein